MEYIRNIGVNKYQRGATRSSQPTWARQGAQARPGGLCSPRPTSSAHLLVYKSFWHRKNKRSTFGTKRRCLEAEPGQQLFCSQTGRFRLGNFPPGGGNWSHRHHQRSSHREGVNLHQHLHQHHLLSNPSSSLVSDLCLKTLDWYLWVASSVDYSL